MSDITQTPDGVEKTTNNNSETTQNNEWRERELGALWVKNGKSSDFLSGHVAMEGQRVDIVVFRNKNKTSDRGPDYILYKSKPLDQHSIVTKTPKVDQNQSDTSNASDTSEDYDDAVPALLR